MAQLFYYSKSADKRPGKGSNETLGTHELSYFDELASIPHWRKILSNFYEGIFEFEGKHYQTVEHCFQGNKISGVDPKKGELFAMESQSRYSKGGGEMARQQRKMVILSSAQLSEWNQRKDLLLERILRAKFTQVEMAKEALLATRDAELWHGARGVPKARQVSLEKIREEISLERIEQKTDEAGEEEEEEEEKGEPAEEGEPVLPEDEREEGEEGAPAEGGFPSPKRQRVV
jgi:predicted NAD-dependent protein-ADP-ribosyltransferase YbiA (DUF1768 family)